MEMKEIGSDNAARVGVGDPSVSKPKDSVDLNNVHETILHTRLNVT
jgi:hypothetical protein